MASAVPRMDALESRAWLALIGTAELLPTALDAQLQADSGMTHFEFIVLSALQRAPQRTMRLGELAGVTSATLPRLSKVVSRLAARGLVERAAAPDDGRAVDVRLLPAGRREVVRATPGHIAEARRRVIDRLSREQLAALADALEPVAAALDPQQRFRRAAGDDAGD